MKFYLFPFSRQMSVGDPNYDSYLSYKVKKEKTSNMLTGVLLGVSFTGLLFMAHLARVPRLVPKNPFPVLNKNKVWRIRRNQK